MCQVFCSTNLINYSNNNSNNNTNNNITNENSPIAVAHPRPCEGGGGGNVTLACLQNLRALLSLLYMSETVGTVVSGRVDSGVVALCVGPGLKKRLLSFISPVSLLSEPWVGFATTSMNDSEMTQSIKCSTEQHTWFTALSSVVTLQFDIYDTYVFFMFRCCWLAI